MTKDMDTTASVLWNKEYEKGRYQDESPIKFVTQIIQTLEKTQNYSKEGHGLYIGCGNGRNYIPLADSGLNILGIDMSKIATRQLLDRRPHFAEKIQCVDFTDFEPNRQFDYIISIQVFQHGTKQQIKKYFEKTSKILKSGGLLFLRVNSISTDIYFRHIIQQRDNNDGLTVRYTDGPKKDLNIHFYSRQELDKLCKDFKCISLYEDITKRVMPKTGTWSQWESILQKII